ncbi:MAG: hypothetical protein ACKO9A_06605, partial [Alphaproteobacteria bacterium]
QQPARRLNENFYESQSPKKLLRNSPFSGKKPESRQWCHNDRWDFYARGASGVNKKAQICEPGHLKLCAAKYKS